MTIVTGSQDKVEAYINEKCARHRDLGQRSVVIASTETISHYHSDVPMAAGSLQKPDEIARNLYRILREMDEQQAAFIYSEGFDENGIGEAVGNRLRTAAGTRMIRL
jgi:L-threonylcarbamoyladenylate synthase